MKRLLPALVMVTALALTGCVADPNAQYTASARAALASLDGLTDNERIDAVLAFAATNEADVLAASAIDGAELAPLREPFSSFANPDEIIFTPASYSRTADVGTFLGLGFIMVGWMGENGLNLADQGNVGTESGSVPGFEGEVTISPEGNVSGTLSGTQSASGTTATVSAETRVQACPDPDGSLELTGKSDVRLSVGTTTVSISLEVTATGRLDDTATLVESDYTYRHQISMSAGGTGEFFDHSSGASTGVTVNRESSTATMDFAQSAVDAAAVAANMVALDMLDNAKRGWESGRCVNLTVTPSEDPGSLEPNAEITIEAAPTAKSDGQPTEGSVVATLSGEGSLAQAGSKVDAAATYDYTAPDEKNLSGTVTFESRSNRGVGKATLTLETGSRSYSAVGTEGEFTATGIICSLASPFVLTGNGLTLTFTPADENGGAYQTTGSVDGVGFTGDGVYTVARDADFIATTVVVDGTMILSTPDGSTVASPANIDVVLTPIESCG